MNKTLEENAEEWLDQHPDASPAQLAGAVSGLSPADAKGIVDARSGPETPQEHYAECAAVYETLGQLPGRLMCTGNHDFTGWYNNRPDRARPFALAKEWPALESEVERCVYATNTYTRKSWYVDAWTGYEWADKGREWLGEKPQPGYGDIGAYVPLADIDLADEVKHRRPDGDIPREAIESALSQWAEAFASLAGDMDAVYALDSVGGAYMMVAPSATQPLAEELDGRRKELLFDELTDRLNDWVREVDAKVIDEHPELDGVFEADEVNNKNRLFKAPMSVHSSLDGVVTPIDPSAPEYTYTPLESAREDERQRAREWADEYTSGTHRGAVSAIVEAIWPDELADADSWQEAVHTRAEGLLEAQKEMGRRSEKTPALGDFEATPAAGDVPDDLETTDDMDVINSKIEAIDVQSVARDVADAWDTAPNRKTKRFDPPWRRSDSGQSCFATKDMFYDVGENEGGGALKLAALGAGIIKRPSQSLKGSDSNGKKYWQAVAELRKLGHDIPRFEGHDGKHPDVLGLYDDAETEDEEKEQFLKALKA